MKSPERQRGMSLLMLLAIMVLVGFLLLLGIRLVPIYIDYWTIRSVAESVRDDLDMMEVSKGEIRKSLSSHMTLNNLRSYDRDIYSISRSKGGGMEITIEYEERTAFIANLDLVARFERTVGP